MSGNALQEAFKNLAGRKVDTFPAKVVSVDKEAGTCVVSSDGLDFPDVQLSASVKSGGKRFFIFPAVGSSVLVSPINEDIHRLYVEYFSEVDEMKLQVSSGIYIKISLDEIIIESQNKPIRINSGNSSIAITDIGVDITSDKSISLNGGFPALYNKIPGLPISDVSQIGSSTKVKLG